MTISSRNGKINPDLTIGGTDVTKAKHLLANEGICHDGVKLHGTGFIVTPAEAQQLGLGKRPELEKYIRPYRNGRDLAQITRGKMVIDLFGLEQADVRARFPEVYQHLLGTVKPDREKVLAQSGTKDSEAYAKLWWLFGKPRQELRPAMLGLSQFIATVDTARHRIFQFLPSDIICDDKVVIITSDNGYVLGVLQSHIHRLWALRAGGWLGVGNDPVYVKTKVFDPFPFPSPGKLLEAQIREAAVGLDSFRKERQKDHPSLTLTQMYNVLEKVRTEAVLDEHEEHIKKIGLILILKGLHEKLDGLVREAYGWPELSDEEILERLVVLNREQGQRKNGAATCAGCGRTFRFRVSARPSTRWRRKRKARRSRPTLGCPRVTERKMSFPADAVAQTAAVFAALTAAGGTMNAADIAEGFRKTKNLEKTVAGALASLARLGHVTSKDGKHFEIRRAA